MKLNSLIFFNTNQRGGDKWEELLLHFSCILRLTSELSAKLDEYPAIKIKLKLKNTLLNILTWEKVICY